MDSAESNALDGLGLDAAWRLACREAHGRLSALGRVIGEQRGAHIVQTSDDIVLASPSGALRHRQSGDATAQHPAVGDWVLLRAPGEHVADTRRQMLKVLPRRTWVSRKIAGRAHKEQVVAANVDTVLIVCGFGGDINPRKIERFVAIAKSGGAKPVLVLNKDDLANDAELLALSSAGLIANLPTHRVSVHNQTNMQALSPYVVPKRTLVLLGSSGAGKSSLLNAWLNDDSQAVGPVHKSGQGQHTTRTRSLVTLPSGAMVIDTPGVREIGMWDAEVGVSATFSDIVALAAQCRFGNCTHNQEPGCALRAGLDDGSVPALRLEAWRTLVAENDAYAKRAASRRRKSGK